MIDFLGQLQSVAARLRAAPPDGPCDDDCGCVSDPTDPAAITIAFISTSTPTGQEPIVCTLQPSNMNERMDAWTAALTGTLARVAIDGGVRLTLPRTTDIAALAQLVAAGAAACAACCAPLIVAVAVASTLAAAIGG